MLWLWPKKWEILTSRSFSYTIKSIKTTQAKSEGKSSAKKRCSQQSGMIVSKIWKIFQISAGLYSWLAATTLLSGILVVSLKRFSMSCLFAKEKVSRCRLVWWRTSPPKSWRGRRIYFEVNVLSWGWGYTIYTSYPLLFNRIFATSFLAWAKITESHHFAKNMKGACFHDWPIGWWDYKIYLAENLFSTSATQIPITFKTKLEVERCCDFR